MKAIIEASDGLHVGKLITSNECVPPSTAVRYVTDKFFNSAQMDAVALVEGREPVGLIRREHFGFEQIWRGNDL
jgi:tRNA C32,U32 (ribose-2'-O)-methylase TrmJ